MADSPLSRLIDASSLGTPDARLLRSLTDDKTARRIVVRSEQIRDAIHAATPCNRWYCPTSGEVECGVHGGFDVCCDRTDLHQPIDRSRHERRP